MSSIYLYADAASRSILSNELQKIVYIGGDFGHGNFGDVLQHMASLKAAKTTKRFVTVSVMAANAIGYKDFPACTKDNYGADAIVFVADYPLVLDDSSPQLELIDEFRNLSAIHLYGGGFLNNMWGDYVLGVTEYLLRLAPDAAYMVSGQQVTAPYQHRVVKHIKEFKPALFGVRDELSQRLLREAGVNTDISFDDATETLLDLTEKLPLQLGNGLLMHVNASDYTANNGLELGLGYELQQLKASRWGQDGVTLFQAFRDPRHEVCDARETLKKLDATFPFTDLRLIELASLVCGGQSGNLTKPIVGDIGYSCSYHVALWLQLAGIPCWLRSSNPFYDQKSRALQVTQELDSFLAEPRLADHRSNLERRAAWNEKFHSFMLQIPEVFNTCTFRDDGQGPAPWPFFYKGKPTIQEKLLDTEKSDRWQRDRAETSERELAVARAELDQLHGEVVGLTGKLTEVVNESHIQRDRAENAELELGTTKRELEQLHGRVEALSGQLTEVGNEAHRQRDRAERVEGNLGIARGELDHLNGRVEGLTGQLTEVGNDAHRQRDRAESSERELGMARAALDQLHGRVEGLTGQLTEVGNEAHRQRERAESSERELGMVRGELVQLHGHIEALTGQLAKVHASRSWRLTRGLRVIGRILRGEMGLVRDGLRRAITGKVS